MAQQALPLAALQGVVGEEMKEPSAKEAWDICERITERLVEVCKEKDFIPPFFIITMGNSQCRGIVYSPELNQSKNAEYLRCVADSLDRDEGGFNRRN